MVELEIGFNVIHINYIEIITLFYWLPIICKLRNSLIKIDLYIYSIIYYIDKNGYARVELLAHSISYRDNFW